MVVRFFIAEQMYALFILRVKLFGRNIFGEGKNGFPSTYI
jgi:hypothetical protein